MKRMLSVLGILLLTFTFTTTIVNAQNIDKNKKISITSNQYRIAEGGCVVSTYMSNNTTISGKITCSNVEGKHFELIQPNGQRVVLIGNEPLLKRYLGNQADLTGYYIHGYSYFMRGPTFYVTGLAKTKKSIPLPRPIPSPFTFSKKPIPIPSPKIFVPTSRPMQLKTSRKVFGLSFFDLK